MGKLQSLKIVFSKPLGRDFEKTNRLEMRVSRRPCNRLVTARASILGRLANLCLSFGSKTGLNLCKKCMMLCRAVCARGFLSQSARKSRGLCKPCRKNKTRKAEAVAGCLGAWRQASTLGLKTSGHEDGDEGQQENQNSTSGRNDHGDVLDHVFHGIVRCMCVVVSRHGEPQNKNQAIVAKLGPLLPYIKA